MKLKIKNYHNFSRANILEGFKCEKYPTFDIYHVGGGGKPSKHNRAENR